jgi:hypothetical protein
MKKLLDDIDAMIALSLQKIETLKQLKIAVRLQELKNQNPEQTDVVHIVKTSRTGLKEEHWIFDWRQANAMRETLRFSYGNDVTYKTYKLPLTVKVVKATVDENGKLNGEQLNLFDLEP